MREEADAIVVGAGHNGLVAAYYLARAGLRVVVCERRPLVGGACVTEELLDGYRFSTCAGICWKLHPKIVKDLALQRHGFRYQELDPDPISIYPDGSSLADWGDPSRTRREVSYLCPTDAKRFLAWCDFWARSVNLLDQYTLSTPPTLSELAEAANAAGEADLWSRLTERSLASICADYFEDPRVQAAFINVDDVGDPWLRGAALVEAYFHGRGHIRSGFVLGGMGALTEAMARAAASAGATIETSAEVERILVDRGKVRGVTLQDRREISADIVVANPDPKRTWLELVEHGALPAEFAKQLAEIPTRISYLKLHAAVTRLPVVDRYFPRGSVPDHGQIRIAPSLEHYRKAFEQAEDGRPAVEPIVYLHLPTRYDRSLSPRGKHAVSAFVRYAPPRLAEGDWDTRREEVGEQLIDYVDSFLPGFRSSISEWVLMTPIDIERRIGLTDGNIHQVDMLPTSLFGDRPVRAYGHTCHIDGLYLCGAGTHPGGEVSGVPGHNAAGRVLADVRRFRARKRLSVP